MEIRELVRADMTDAELIELTALVNRVDPERAAGDDPYPVGFVAAHVHSSSPTRVQRSWGGYVDGALVGFSQYQATYGMTSNRTCEVTVAVDPDQRRHGYGSTLLAHVSAVGTNDGRSIIQPWGALNDDHDAFLASHGFRREMDERLSRADLHAIDPDLMQRWVDGASERAAGYHLETWIGRCPDHLVEAFCRSIEGMNEAPHDGLTVDRREYSEQRMRDREADFVAAGRIEHVIMAVETATGRGAGYTGVHVLVERPAHAHQTDTTTLLDHRNQGLGRWMKAAMIQWLRRDYPDIRWIDTWNAESNSAMLAINVAMGFRPFAHIGVWQMPGAGEANAEPVGSDQA